MSHRQKILFSSFGCVVFWALLCSGTTCLSATVQQIAPEFSGENEERDTDRLLEAGQLDKLDITPRKIEMSKEMSEKDENEMLEFLEIGTDQNKTIVDEKVSADDRDTTDEVFLNEDGPLEDFAESDSESQKIDFFPGETKPEPAVVYPDFKGNITKEESTQFDIKKPTMGCPDVLLSSQLYSDPSVLLAFTYVYSLCMMELSLQKYLQTEPYLQTDAKGLLGPSKDALREVQRILPSYLVGLEAMVKGFTDGHLREVIDAGRQISQQNVNGIGL